MLYMNNLSLQQKEAPRQWALAEYHISTESHIFLQSVSTQELAVSHLFLVVKFVLIFKLEIELIELYSANHWICSIHKPMPIENY